MSDTKKGSGPGQGRRQVPPIEALPVQNAEPPQLSRHGEQPQPRVPVQNGQPPQRPQQPAQPQPRVPVQNGQPPPQPARSKPLPALPVRNAQPPKPLPPIPQHQPPVISATPVIAQGQGLPVDRAGTLSVGEIATLPENQRVWTDNVFRALNLKSKGSQARVLAGAIATTELLRQANSPDLPEATRLLTIVTSAGNPPWKDTRLAMAATDAKMKLDLLSIPPATRKLTVLDSGGSANATFLVNRLDADGHTRPAFLCKPTLKPTGLRGDKVAGIPDGGEVIREAIAARAAQTFTSQTGIDVRMPESHVVTLAGDMLPGGQPADPSVTASIQEFGPGMEQIKKLTALQRAAIPADQIAALAVFDLMTLNTDRHSGNIMCDAQGNMLPIDHGCCFVQGDEGLARLAQTMGGPHNVLLTLPAAFDPMSDVMVRKLKAMKTSVYGASLKVDRDLIAAAHPKMLDKVKNEALKWAQQAARFAKLAASNIPPLSPGGMQVAFSTHAAELFKAKDFDTVAKAVIAQAATHADTMRTVCLSDDIDYAELVRQVNALGWRVQERHIAPRGGFADPVLLVMIVDRGIRYQKVGDVTLEEARAAVVAQFRAATPSPDAMKLRLLTLRFELITKMIAAMAQNDRQAQTTALRGLPGTVEARMVASAGLLNTVRVLALAEQQALYTAKIKAGVSLENWRAEGARNAALIQDPVAMAIHVAAME